MNKIGTVIKGCAVALVLGGIAFGAGAHESETSALDAAITMVDAQNIALQQVSGTLLGSELEEEDGVLVWEIKIRNENSELVEVEIDAQSGAILETEIEDD